MKILFIHQNFPGQFKHLAPALSAAGHEVYALTLRGTTTRVWKGVVVTPYSLGRTNGKGTHPLASDFESKVIRGEACMEAALQLKAKGFYPAVIVAHPGWGESLYLRLVWPEASIKIYCEYYYHESGFDVGFDPEFSENSEHYSARVITKNANVLLAAEQATAAISPTAWQAGTFPPHIREKISVIHDGIDTESLVPNSEVRITIPKVMQLSQSDEVITFVSRTLEPYRGFHIFLRSAIKILREKPESVILIVGDEKGGYGAAPPQGSTWKQVFWNEVRPRLEKEEAERVKFLGPLPYEQYLAVLQVSSVHVYLTYPFVLSWSLMEAMSLGCTIVASDTEPVREVIEHEKSGLLVDFFDADALADAVVSILSDKTQARALGLNARSKIAEQYDLRSVALPKQIEWVVGPPI